MDEASKNELVRFAKHPFKPNGDKRVWPRFLAKEFSSVSGRLKVAKRRLRLGLGSRAAVEWNEGDLSEVIARAKEYWLEARKSFPATKPKVNRRPVGQRQLKKPKAANADSSSDGASKIDLGKSVAAISLRTRQLERLDLASPDFSREVATMIAAELAVTKGGTAALNRSFVGPFDDADSQEGPDANAHILTLAVYLQHRVRKPSLVRSSQYVGWSSGPEIKLSPSGFSEKSSVRVRKKLMAMPCEDRLCSAINPAAAYKFEPTDDATEQVGFLFYYNPNRRRI